MPRIKPNPSHAGDTNLDTERQARYHHDVSTIAIPSEHVSITGQPAATYADAMGTECHIELND